jgi:hypothetical protein
MLAFLITLAQAAPMAASPIPVVPTPTVATPADPSADAPLPLPMSLPAWRALSPDDRTRYADATIQGLRRNPTLAQCEALVPGRLAEGIDAVARPGEPLMMAVAAAAYGLCS